MDKILLKNGTEIKRHFYNERDYKIDEVNKVVELNSELKVRLLNKNLWGRFGYKKVGGSSFGDVLGSNPFGSKFCASAKIMWLAEPIYDPIYVDAGQAIEPKVVAAMEQISGKKYKTYPAAENNYDYFSGLEHLGGLPDAALPEEGKLYELKTTGAKNESKWDEFGVPEYYKQQACLYDFLMFGMKSNFESREATIVACFLQPEDYADPEAVDVSQRTIKTYKVKYTADEAVAWLKQATEFRKQVVREGKSFTYDESNKNDQSLLEYLRCRNKSELVDLLKKRGLL